MPHRRTSAPVARAAPVLLAGLVGVLVAGAALTGCSSGPATRPAAGPATGRLVASVTQFRQDEGTRNLKAGVTNDSDQDIRVTRATIAWDGFAFPTVPITDGPVHPGQTAAFPIAYGRPRCDRPAATRPTLLAVIDGRTRRLPLRVEDPGLLDRLRAKACAQLRLDEVAGVALRLATRTVRRRGEEYLPGDLVIRHRSGATGRVRLVDLLGSVLLDLVPRGGPRALPGVLAPDRQTLRFPVLLGSAHRCDAHALSQSSQTYLISGYVRLDGQPAQRVILALAPAERDRLAALVRRDCR